MKLLFTGVLVGCLIVIYGLVLLIRNKLVFNEHMRVLRIISEKSKQDIDNGRAWLWRYDGFDAISYDEMLYKIWKPVKSFFKDSLIIQ